jgi:CO/xanthine dehydrogenase Mo-binding subunit
MASISAPVQRLDAAPKAEGRAAYLADLRFDGMLHARIVASTCARGRVRSIRYPDLPTGYAAVDARDIPAGGANRILMIGDDWPVFADAEVRFRGQTVALLVGPDRAVLASLAARTAVEYAETKPVLSIDDSLALVGGPLHGTNNLFADYTIVKGDPDAAFARASAVFEEQFSTGAQEHVYLEPQGCVAVPGGAGMTLHASTQCPFYVRKAVAHALGWPRERVRVVVPEVGGGFGGKEHYPDVLATAAAVAALKTGRPVRIVLDRAEDLRVTCKRHPARIRFRTALDDHGAVAGMEIDIILDGGAYETCSPVVLQRALFTSTGVYDIPNVRVRGRAVATNVVPSDAFRGFGAPQALFAIEMHMDHLARRAGADPVDFRRRSFIRQGGTTVTNGRIHEEVPLGRMLDRVLAASGYRAKSVAVGVGRGIGISFAAHGCAFTGGGERDLIKARVGLRKRSDDRVEILAAGVDMGQGLTTAFRKVVAGALGIPLASVLSARPDTDLVPDSGPTIASRSTMVVGRLLELAARRLKEGWRDGEEQEAWQDYAHPPHLAWDPETLQGDAYPAWGWGVNAVEVAVDYATREVSVVRAWAVYDVGVPVDRLAVEGQAHGGMVQALGWAGLEKLENRGGEYRQATLADYAIPTSLDAPPIVVDFVENPYPLGPSGAKGAGELVFDAAGPAFAMAVQQAVGVEFHDLPLTPERIAEAAP